MNCFIKIFRDTKEIGTNVILCNSSSGQVLSAFISNLTGYFYRIAMYVSSGHKQ